MIAIEIMPIIEDNYYRTIVYDLEADDSGRPIRFVRDIYHSDSFTIAVELLHRLTQEGAL